MERTRCVELRAFVPDEEPAQDVDMDQEAACGDGLVLQFYLCKLELKAASKDTEMEDVEAEHPCCPEHLGSERYTCIKLDGIPRGANRATLRQKLSQELKKRKVIELHRATLFHVVGGAEVETTLELALRGEEMPPGRVVHVEVRKPIEYRCASQRIQ